MVQVPMRCSKCLSDSVVKYGKASNGAQRFSCKNNQCDIQTFINDYKYHGCQQETAQKVLDMTMNSSGIRDTERVLNIHRDTVISKLKRFKEPERVNIDLLSRLKNPSDVKVDIVLVDEAEVDEMWSFVQKKSNQRWLWWAIDHNTGDVLAFTFGERKDEVFRELQSMLAPFGIGHFYTDNWGAYSRNIPSIKHSMGKDNTWKIERKHLNLRTRIKRLTRKTICFSKSVIMHDLVIGLFISRVEFGLT